MYKSIVADRIVLRERTTNEKGYVSSTLDESALLGAIGIVLTELRPAGTGLFGTSKLDVVSQGNYIEKGEKVQIIAVNGSRIVVRKVNGGDV